MSKKRLEELLKQSNFGRNFHLEGLK